MGSTGRTKEHRELIAQVGDKWSLLIMEQLRANGRRRFSELKKGIGSISQRMLTLTLRGMERNGLVTRTVHAEMPQRVEYELTSLGRSAAACSSALLEWSDVSIATVAKAQAAYDSAA